MPAEECDQQWGPGYAKLKEEHAALTARVAHLEDVVSRFDVLYGDKIAALEALVHAPPVEATSANIEQVPAPRRQRTASVPA